MKKTVLTTELVSSFLESRRSAVTKEERCSLKSSVESTTRLLRSSREDSFKEASGKESDCKRSGSTCKNNNNNNNNNVMAVKEGKGEVGQVRKGLTVFTSDKRTWCGTKRSREERAVR